MPSDDDKREERSSSAAIVVSLAFAVLFFYPLSYGPFVWLARHGYLGREPHHIESYAYGPLLLAYDHNETFQAVANWYIHLWT